MHVFVLMLLVLAGVVVMLHGGLGVSSGCWQPSGSAAWKCLCRGKSAPLIFVLAWKG